MSQKRIREEVKPEISQNLPVVSKCLAIVLIPNSRRNSNSDQVFHDNNEADETIVDVNNDGRSVDVSEVGKNVSSCGYNGKELLQDFKVRNKTCYWNPSLVESITSLEYKGFVEPSTILVTGADIHLENLRSAWGRRVLKAPAGFLIDRIGDVNGIQMQVIPQTRFMPLPDALCNIIMDLNLRRILATLDMVLEKLSLWYKDMTVPHHQLVINTLDTLIKERKVFHNGSCYFVVTPDTSRLHTSVNSSYLPTNASWLPYHPMYIPVFQGELPLMPSRAHMRSISCQVTTIEETSEDDEDRDGKADQDGAGKTCAGQKPSQPPGGDYHCRKEELKVVKGEKEELKVVKGEKEELKVVRSEEEEAKPELDEGVFKRPLASKDKVKVVKDSKSGGSRPDKEKGEKTSLFSKLFSRKKKDKDKDRVLMPPPPALPPPLPPLPLVSSCSVITSTSGSDTMSEGRGEKEYATFSAQFPPPEWVWYQQQMEKHKRTETWVSQQSSNIGAAVHLPPTFAKPPVKKKSQQHQEPARHAARRPAMLQTQEHAAYISMSAVSSLEDKFVDSEVVKHDDDGFVRPWPVRSENIYESFSATSSIRRHRHKPGENCGKCCQRTSEYGGAVSGDTTPFNSSNVYQSVRTLSPVARVSEEGSYAKLIEPQLGPLHSTPFVGKQNDRTTYRVEGHETRDRIYGPPEAYNRRRSSRSQRRHQRLYSFYSGQGSDISYEYKGRLPKRNSSRAQSRDSGVNCVGLGVAANHDKRTEPLYENTVGKQKYSSHQQQYGHEQYSNYKHLADNQTQFEITNATENTDINTESIIDSTTTSLVYQGRATHEAYNSVVYQDSLTNEAYNSVVYGSMFDVNGAPSVICHTIASSCQENSELPLPYNSLQSTFYEDSRVGSALRQMSPKTSRHLAAGSQGSPDTVIVDVVGTASESEGDDSDSSDDMPQHASPNELREMVGPMKCHPMAVKPMCRQQKLDDAVNYETGDENGDEVDGGDPCDCCHGIAERQEYEKPVDSGHRNTDNKVSSEPSVVPNLRERTDRLVLDSGFSSPRNPEKSADGVGSSDQSNSSKPQGSGASTQGVTGFPQLQHQHSHDSCNTHRSSTNASSGHHSNSDACLATGSDHQSGSVSDNGNSSSGAFSGHRDCDQITSDKSRMKHGCSLNSLKSECFVGHAQYKHEHMQQLRQNLVHHSRPASKHAHHYDTYEQLVRTKYKEHSQRRIPLHPNAMLVEHRPHHRSRPQQERSRSVDLLQSDSRNDLHKFGRKYHSKRYGLMDEFEVMGVL